MDRHRIRFPNMREGKIERKRKRGKREMRRENREGESDEGKERKKAGCEEGGRG